tara:strand:+ start:151 stop:450 length:300 start_codon:yes stop_codon:yes gene_type:complete
MGTASDAGCPWLAGPRAKDHRIFLNQQESNMGRFYIGKTLERPSIDDLEKWGVDLDLAKEVNTAMIAGDISEDQEAMLLTRFVKIKMDRAYLTEVLQKS